VIGDPALRSAEGVVLLSQQTTREAHILASTIFFWWSARCGGGPVGVAIRWCGGSATARGFRR
jgi:hypothetical protein